MSAAQFLQTVFQVGGYTDTLSVRAGDGQAWSDWVYFTVSNAPPVVTVLQPSVTVTHHSQTFAASSLFSASDPDGDQLKYILTGDGDPSADRAGNIGHWILNGVPQAVDATLTLTQAQFNQAVWYSGPSTEDLYLQVDDGQPGGAVSNIGHVVIHGAPDTAAVVTDLPANGIYALHGQTFALTSLFTASDPDGDSITQYRIENDPSWSPYNVLAGSTVPSYLPRPLGGRWGGAALRHLDHHIA